MVGSAVMISCNKSIVYSIETAYFQENSQIVNFLYFCTYTTDEWNIINAVL